MSAERVGYAVAAVVRIALAAAFAIAATNGLQWYAACGLDLPVIATAVLLYGWTVRWLLSAARFERAVHVVQCLSFAAAAVLFATEAVRNGTSRPFGWWPPLVALLLAVASVVYARIAANRPRGRITADAARSLETPSGR
jgi:hypothetical protein